MFKTSIIRSCQILSRSSGCFNSSIIATTTSSKLYNPSSLPLPQYQQVMTLTLKQLKRRVKKRPNLNRNPNFANTLNEETLRVLSIQDQDQQLLPLPKYEFEFDNGKNPDKLFKTIELEALGYEPGILDSYEWFVRTSATHLGIKLTKVNIPQKTRYKYTHVRFPLLRCVHIFKKAQVHYEVRTYHLILILHRLTGSTADTFLEYIERNLPEGVGLKVTKVEVQSLPEYLQKPIEEAAAEAYRLSDQSLFANYYPSLDQDESLIY